MNQDRLTDLLVAWGLAREAGRELSARELCADCPELLGELERQIRQVQSVQDFINLSNNPAEPAVALPPATTMMLSMTEVLPDSKLRPEEFARALENSGVIEGREIEPLRRDQPHRDARAMASELVGRKKLTSYQARVLLEGRDQPLLLDRYLILDEIGSGGMGAVFKAVHRQMDRVVAIKILPKAAVDSPDKVKRFHQETRAAGRLHHPNIVVAHDAYESGGIHFLVMEYVPGENLEQLVYRQGPLSVGKAVHYLLQTAQGLAYAHEKGVIHRDIKPSNLLVGSKGILKILDLGLARIEASQADWSNTLSQELTQPGLVMGTAPYLPPEQALDTHSADARSDIYSLGCTLHFLLTGRPMYLEDTLMKTLVAHREQPIPSLRTRRIDVPKELDKLFQKMVAKNPKDRQQNMGELHAELKRLEIADAEDEADFELSPGISLSNSTMQDTQTAMETQSGLEQPAPTTPHARRRKSWWLGGFLGLLVLGIALVIVFRVKTPAGTIVLEMDRDALSGAIVSVDGKHQLTITPGANEETIRVEADENTHTLKVTKGGFETFTKSFTVKADQRQTIQVRLEPVSVTLHAPVQAGDQDRLVAEWVQQLKGNVGLRFPATGDYLKRTPDDALPEGEFRVETIGIRGEPSSLADSDLKVLHDLPELTTLTLNDHPKLTGEGFAHLQRLPNLQKVFLLGTGVGDRALQELARFPKLTHLYAGGSEKRITDEGIEFLAGLTNLTELQFGECSITDAGLAALDQHKHLALLRIYSTPITAEGLKRFQQFHPDCRIETDVPGFHSLPVHSWPKNERQVAEWILQQGGIAGLQGDGYGFKDFFSNDSLPEGNFQVITAGLDGKTQPLTDADLKRFDNLPSLTTLVLSDQTIGNSGLANLGRLPRLQKLYIRGTKVTDEGLKELARFPELTHLHVSSVKAKISDQGIPHLLPLEQLRELQLGTNDITRNALKELGKLPGLRVLHLYGSKLTRDEIQAFQQEHHKIQIFTEEGEFPAIDPTDHYRRNREVAEWVHNSGGDVGISGPKIGYVTLYSKDPLPEERFSLSVVALNGTNLTDLDMGRFHNLQYLGLLMIKNRNVTDQGLANLGYLPSLDGLMLGEAQITDRGLKEVKRFPKMAVLHIGGPNTNITDQGIEELLPLKEIKELRLNETKITDRSLDLLGQFPKLKHLEVSRTNLSKAGVERFHALYPDCYLMSDFGIYQRPQGSQISSAVAQASPDRQARKSPDRQVAEWIHSIGGWVGIAGGGSPFRDIKPEEQLPNRPFVIATASLDPPGGPVPFSDEDLKRFDKLNSLTTLILNGTSVTDQGLANLGDLPNLDKLYLGGTGLTDEGLKTLTRYPKMIVLHLGGSKGRITNEGLKSIAPLKNLIELSLVNCQVTDEGLKSLEKLPHLRRFLIQRTKIGKEALQFFHRTHPKCHVESEFGVFAPQP